MSSVCFLHPPALKVELVNAKPCPGPEQPVYTLQNPSPARHLGLSRTCPFLTCACLCSPPSGVQVELVDANHCPGAVQFVFTRSDGARFVHCGDMRFCASLTASPVLQRAVGCRAVRGRTSEPSGTCAVLDIRFRFCQRCRAAMPAAVAAVAAGKGPCWASGSDRRRPARQSCGIPLSFIRRRRPDWQVVRWPAAAGGHFKTSLAACGGNCSAAAPCCSARNFAGLASTARLLSFMLSGCLQG